MVMVMACFGVLCASSGMTTVNTKVNVNNTKFVVALSTAVFSPAIIVNNSRPCTTGMSLGIALSITCP
jgi:hypothetical protein